MNELENQIFAWLRLFSHAVREQNFLAAEELFDRKVISFGTVGHMLSGLERLKADQWKVVWPKTSGFDFNYNSAAIRGADSFAFVMAEWSSTGYDREGRPFPREGRATLVLEKQNSAWKALHTHFSFKPSAVHDPLLHHPSSPLHG